jgi:site-specific recombinase XerD
MTDLERSVAEFLAAKRHDLHPNTHQQRSYRLASFVRFLTRAGIHTAADIRREHLTAYRDTWSKFADSTQRQFSVATKQFLRDVDREDLVKKFETPKPTLEGIERRKPRPFSDAENREISCSSSSTCRSAIPYWLRNGSGNQRSASPASRASAGQLHSHSPNQDIKTSSRAHL